MKQKLHAIVDSVDYVNKEVYQHQLHKKLRERFDVSYHEISSLDKIVVNDDEILFSALKIRTLRAKLDLVQRCIGDKHIIVQDYDPWVSFDDTSQYKGTYELVSDKLNVTYFVPSVEWSRFVIASGHKCVTSKIGMLPEYCEASTWESRTTSVEFRGSKYQSRTKAMNKLFDSGFPKCWVDGIVSPYLEFLKHLSTVKVWAHSESEPVTVDGKPMCRNWLWPKAIEVLSRGCFLIRDHHPEALNYVEGLPTVFLFKEEREALDMLEHINSLTNKERNSMICETVEKIRSARYYETICDRLPNWCNIDHG